MALHLSLVSPHRIQFPKKVYDIHYNEQRDWIVGACQNRIYSYKFQQEKTSIQNISKLNIIKQIASHPQLNLRQQTKTKTREYFSNKNLTTYKSNIVHTSHNCIYLDEIPFIFENDIQKVFIDKHGLFNISYRNKISLCKVRFSHQYQQKSSKCNLGNIAEKHLQNIGQLTQLDYITSFYMKNSLLISGSLQGYITLWDINKLKIFHQNQFFRKKVNGVNTFLNYLDCNIYMGWSSIQKRVSFHDLRTNEAISIISNINTDIGLQVQSSGNIVAISKDSFQVINIMSGFKRQNKNKNQSQLFTQRKNHEKLKKSRINNIVGIYHNEIQLQCFKGLKQKYHINPINSIEKQNDFEIKINKLEQKQNKKYKHSRFLAQKKEKQNKKEQYQSNQNTKNQSLDRQILNNIITCSLVFKNCLILGTSKGFLYLSEVHQLSTFKQKTQFGKSLKVSSCSIKKIISQKERLFVLDQEGKVYFIRVQLC